METITMQHQHDQNRFSYVAYLQPALRALVLFAIAMLVASCGRSPGGLVFVDQAAALDRAQIAAAAAPLIELGATVVVFTTAQGDTNGDDFTRRLDAAGLLRSGQIAPAAIALYISFEPRYSEFRAGTDWSSALPDTTLRAIRLDTLNPALRSGDASGGVIMALAAVDERARFGPFGMRRDYAAVALWVIIGAGMLLLVIGPRSLVDWLRWSRAGQFCHDTAASLWARTPPGRAQAQRRLVAQLDQSRQRLQAAAAEAHTTRQVIESVPDDLQARLERADHEYAQLEQQAPDRTLLAALAALTSVYRQIHTDLVAFERKQKQLAAALTTQATQAHERMTRVQRSFQRASAPSRRSWKTRRTISAPGRQRLEELQARQTQLDLQRAACVQAALPLAERHDRLAQLTRDYAALYADATNLWQAECPGEYAASISAQQSQSYDSTSSDSSYSSPSSSTSSSSDYSSDWSSTSSSEPSSDGGTW
jgi:uncharacterized membrane protein YgcG